MSGRVLRADWYRFRCTLRQRAGSYLALTLMLALVGGVALASVAGARRTQSSPDALLRETAAADTGGVTAVLDPAQPHSKGYDPTVIARIARLPNVKTVTSEVGVNISPLGSDGAPIPNYGSAGSGIGSVDGAGITMDRFIPVQGRVPDANRADEFLSDPIDAHMLHWHVGSVVTFGVYSNAQTLLPDFGTPKVKPIKQVQETLVGIGVENRGVIQDDTDANVTLTSGFFTPALTRPLINCCANYTTTDVQVTKGADVQAVADAVTRLVPGAPNFVNARVIKAQAERTIRPDAIALGVFGAIAAIAALLIAALMIGRYVQAGAEERAVVRAFGAEPLLTTTDGLLGVLAAIIVGSLLAAFTAFLLSPLAPIGPLRRVLPLSFVFDWSALGFGVLALVVVLSAFAVFVSYRTAPHRVRRRRRAGGRVSQATSGLPPSTAIGVQFALEPGAGRTAVPVRAAIVGATLAVLVVVTTLTFGASFRSLISRPALYGWNWNYALIAGTGAGDIPEQQGAQLVANDPDVAASSAAYFGTMTVDGTVTAVLGETPGTAVQPPLLSGQGLQHGNEIVLGASTLAALHKHVGDTVTVSASGPATTLRIAGTATLPAIGIGGQTHLEMGAGALVPFQLIPPKQRNEFDDPITGPNAIFVRWKPGTNDAAALPRLQRIAQQLSNQANFGTIATPVQRPAEIVNYRTMGGTPLLLGGALALGAVIALLLTLLASVRRRRRDLALLKTLGFTRGQLASTITWQSTIAVVIGLVVGIPLGVLLGRELWIGFAREIHAVPAPTVSVLTLLVVIAGGLALAVLVSLLPARAAARTPAAVLLRAD